MKACCNFGENKKLEAGNARESTKHRFVMLNILTCAIFDIRIAQVGFVIYIICTMNWMLNLIFHGYGLNAKQYFKVSICTLKIRAWA